MYLCHTILNAHYNVSTQIHCINQSQSLLSCSKVHCTLYLHNIETLHNRIINTCIVDATHSIPHYKLLSEQRSHSHNHIVFLNVKIDSHITNRINNSLCGRMAPLRYTVMSTLSTNESVNDVVHNLFVRTNCMPSNFYFTECTPLCLAHTL